MQFQSPSGKQSPVRMEMLAEDGVLDGGETTDVGAAAATDEEAEDGEAWEGTGAKTPPVGVALATTERVVETGAGACTDEEGTDAAELDPDPELDEPDGEEPEAPAVSPAPPKVGVPVQAGWPSGARLDGSPRYATSSPGLGKRISTSSLVVQPLIFATNMGGKEEDRLSNWVSTSAERLEEPPVTVIGAQFMYISRFPIRLNQVQARVYLPGEIPSGMVKLKAYGSGVLAPPAMFPLTLAGQPPSKDLMTIHSELLEGCRSVVRLI